LRTASRGEGCFQLTADIAAFVRQELHINSPR
jgi:hypothetical protein